MNIENKKKNEKIIDYVIDNYFYNESIIDYFDKYKFDIFVSTNFGSYDQIIFDSIIKNDNKFFYGSEFGMVNELLLPLYDYTDDKKLLLATKNGMFKPKDIILNTETGFHFPFSPVTNQEIFDVIIDHKDELIKELS